MARVDCSHSIAWADLIFIKRGEVQVVLGGDVRGTIVLPMDPAVICNWILKTTGLGCFSFGMGFEQLKAEVEKLGIFVESEWWREKCQIAMQEVKKYLPGKPHAQKISADSWQASKYTEEESEEEKVKQNA